jgi:hypothetical protein
LNRYSGVPGTFGSPYVYDVIPRESKRTVSYPNTSFPSIDERFICSSTKKQKTIEIQEKENELHKKKRKKMKHIQREEKKMKHIKRKENR